MAREQGSLVSLLTQYGCIYAHLGSTPTHKRFTEDRFIEKGAFAVNGALYILWKEEEKSRSHIGSTKVPRGLLKRFDCEKCSVLTIHIQVEESLHVPSIQSLSIETITSHWRGLYSTGWILRAVLSVLTWNGETILHWQEVQKKSLVFGQREFTWLPMKKIISHQHQKKTPHPTTVSCYQLLQAG